MTEILKFGKNTSFLRTNLTNVKFKTKQCQFALLFQYSATIYFSPHLHIILQILGQKNNVKLSIAFKLCRPIKKYEFHLAESETSNEFNKMYEFDGIPGEKMTSIKAHLHSRETHVFPSVRFMKC